MNGGMALVLDVARFKYPSYWVPMKRLFESLIPFDTKTGQPRYFTNFLSNIHHANHSAATLFSRDAKMS